MKILIISENIPKPDFSSGDRRFLGILKILAQRHEVTFCIPNLQPWLKVEDNQQYIDYIEALNIRFLPFNKGWFEQVITDEIFDIGFFEFFWIAEKYMIEFSKKQPKSIVIVDSVDLHFAREETQLKLGQISKRKVSRTKRRELSVYRLADITVAVSNEDCDRLATKEKTGHVSFIPNVVPTVKRTQKDRDPSLLFIGCYAWPPNEDGMLWFTENVWPLVLAKKSDTKLYIVGSQPTDKINEMANLQGVVVTGQVPETAPYLDQAAVSIAPLRYGGGMKGKVNEALAHGLPVVSTSIGAQGFVIQNGVEMFVADEPEAFAEAVLKLLNDPKLQKKVGLAGQQLNESLCSPRVISENIDEMIALSRNLQKSPDSRRSLIATFKVWFYNFMQQKYWRHTD